MFDTKFFNSLIFIRTIFYVALFMIITIAGVAYRHYKELEELNRAIKNRYEIAIELEKLNSHLKDAETGNRGFTLTNDSIFLEPFTHARQKVNKSFNSLKKQTSTNKKQQEHLKKIYNLVDQRFIDFDKEFKTKQEFFKNLKNGKKIMDSLRVEINTMFDYEKSLLKVTYNLYDINSSNSPLIIFASFIISVFIIVLGYFKISKNYIKVLKTNERFKIYDESSKQSQILGNYGSWVYNMSTNEFMFSENYYRLFGFEPNDPNMTFENLIELVHPEDKEAARENFKLRNAREQNPPFPFRIKKNNSDEISHLRTKSMMIRNANGEKTLLGTTRDFTEEYENMLLIEEHNRELKNSVKELSEFNHAASHDLQEPLRKIQTFISRIEEKESEKFSENGKIYFEKIKNSATRMRILVDDLLQFSRTNRSENIFETIDLIEITENAIGELSEIITEKNATINYDNLPKINAIKFQTNQLFINIIGNSLKYSTPEVNPEITITHELVDSDYDEIITNKKIKNYHKITFSDNGIGFEQEYSKKIFNLFERLHEKTKYPGTGVGLAICKKIIDNHNGFIKAKSTLGKGAKFTIYLPE